MFKEKQRQAKNEHSLGNYIPYASLVEDDTVMLRDRTLLACFYIEGVTFETKSNEEVEQASSVINRFLTGLEDDRLSIQIHRMRRPFQDRWIRPTAGIGLRTNSPEITTGSPTVTR